MSWPVIVAANAIRVRGALIVAANAIRVMMSWPVVVAEEAAGGIRGLRPSS